MIKILEDLHRLTVSKNTDYGNSFMKSIEKHGMIASIIRIEDKINRLQSLEDKINLVKDESKIDTLKDLLNYCILSILFLENGYLEENKLYENHKELCERFSQVEDNIFYGTIEQSLNLILNIQDNDSLQMYAMLEPYTNIAFLCLNKLMKIENGIHKI